MLRKFFSFVVLTITALFAGAVSASATPEVSAEVKEATTNTITITFTPNSEVKEYYVVQFDKGGMEETYAMWQPSSGMFGSQWNSPSDMIKAWGRQQTKVSTSTWKDLAPNEEYDFCIASYDANGKEAPIQTYTFGTLKKGGDGPSVIDIEIKEFSQKDGKYLQRIICRANDQTSRFYSQPWPDKWTDEEGVEHHYSVEDAKAYLQELYDTKETRDMYALYDVDDWTWEVQYAAKYHATAMGLNANGEWGEMTDYVFTTPGYVDPNAASLWWGYGDGENIAFSNGPSSVSTRVGAVQVPADVLNAYDGATLTDIKFAVAGDGQCTDVSYFIFKGDIKDYASNLIPVGTLKTGWHEFHLDNPLTVHAGEKIFIGYQATGKRPIAIAGENGVPGSCYIGGGSSFVDYGELDGYNYELAVQVRLESNNFSASANLSEVGDLVAETWQPLEVKGTVTSLTPVPITKYMVQLQVDGVAVAQSSRKVNLDEKGAADTFTLKTTSGFSEGEHTYTLALVSLNGEALENPVVREGKLTVKDIYLTRRHVFEDMTGTWCGYCPRAAAGLEWMKKAHPESVIAIAVHKSDAYEISDYSQLNVSGYPHVFINRGDKCGGGAAGDLESYYNKESKKDIEGECRIVAAEWADASHNTVSLIVRNRFAADYNEHSYRLGFVVTEDDIYAHQSSNIPEIPSGMTYLQDVARKYDSYAGIANSVPQQITKGERYYYRYDLRFPTNVSNRDKAHVIALLQKGNGKTIVNGDIISHIDEPGTNNLDGIGTVLRTDVSPVAEPYDLQGRRIAAPQRGQINILNGRKVIR